MSASHRPAGSSSPVSPFPSQLPPYHQHTAAEAYFQGRKSSQPESVVSPLGSEWPDSPILGHPSPVSIMSPILPRKFSQQQEVAVSPLNSECPDSPTLGYLSPVSIMSPQRPVHLPEPLRLDREAAKEESRFATPKRADGSVKASDVPQATAAEDAQPAPLGRGDTFHLQDHIPYKPASTRFPPRKPLPNQPVEIIPAVEAGPSRPITMYLSDHHPHLVAPLPRQPIARPNYSSGRSYHEGRAEGAGFLDVELREANARPQGMGDDEEKGEGGITEEKKRKRMNWIIGSVFVLVLVVAIVLFAVLLIEANKPGGAAA